MLKEINLIDEYSIKNNITLFKSLYSLNSFWKWYFKKARNIKKNELLELSDFENEQFNYELQKSLIKLERSLVPGYINPIVKKISQYILVTNENILVFDLGAGSMELTRQIIKKLIKNNFKHTITIVGFDKSIISSEIAYENLSSIKQYVEIIKYSYLHEKELFKVLKSEKKISVVICNNDIFNIKTDFKNTKIDLAYHSFFKHHLTVEQKEELDNLLQARISKAFEYDGYHSYTGMLVQALFTWRNPILLANAIFSNIKYYSKYELKELFDKESITFYYTGNFFSYMGTYMRIFN